MMDLVGFVVPSTGPRCSRMHPGSCGSNRSGRFVAVPDAAPDTPGTAMTIGGAFMDLPVKGKAAIGGGAGKGSGRGCARVLADEGANVMLCSRSPTDLDQAAG